jgi:hypothetical protein
MTATSRLSAWPGLNMPLVAVAVAAGRMPNEPATILDPAARPTFIARLFGFRRYRPLADPRLEVLRAISASLTRGVARISEDLLEAAHRVGWTDDDLRRVFPEASFWAQAG